MADTETLICLTSDIVAAHLSNNRVGVVEVSGLITSVYAALSELGEADAGPESRPDPAVSVRASVKKDHLACLECGRKLTMLKRHIATEHGLTPSEYRQRWDLPSDYPMVAPDYVETCKERARKSGLGRTLGRKKKA